MQSPGASLRSWELAWNLYTTNPYKTYTIDYIDRRFIIATVSSKIYSHWCTVNTLKIGILVREWGGSTQHSSCAHSSIPKADPNNQVCAALLVDHRAIKQFTTCQFNNR